MDDRTVRLFDALKHPGAAFLLRLLDGPALEMDLVSEQPSPNQSTANRRLAAMEGLGLVVREPGRPKAPGRTWRLTRPDQTAALLAAGNELSSSLARREAAQRAADRRRLRRAADRSQA